MQSEPQLPSDSVVALVQDAAVQGNLPTNYRINLKVTVVLNFERSLKW
jgi:hypothetical protein